MKVKFFIICILICGCNQKPDTINLKSIDFYSNPGSEISNLSEIATGIEYIPLQILGSGIQDLRKTNDRYYIKNYSGEIECLDKNGRFLYKLSKKGNAADEYESLLDYDLTSNGRLLAISTLKAVKIYEDNGTDFIFLKSIDIIRDNIVPFNLSFVPGETNLLLSFYNLGTEPFIDILLNSKGDTLAVRSNYYRFKKGLEIDIFLRNIQYKYNNTLLFKEPVNDLIYSVDDADKIEPYLVLNSQGQQFTQKIAARIQSGGSKERLSDYFNIIALSETPRYLIGMIIYRKMEFFRFYDKVNDKYYSFSKNSLFIKDNMAGGVGFMPKYCDGSKLYYWISASKLKDHIASEDFLNSEATPEKKADLKKLADSLQELESQVLIVVTPKE